jgi:hypothetical protein
LFNKVDGGVNVGALEDLAYNGGIEVEALRRIARGTLKGLEWIHEKVFERQLEI